jgi:transcriptional regulator with XRE-family HTH domain
VHGLNPLRRARQARGLTLQEVASVTKLSPRVLLKIEMGEFGALPSGLNGRAHIRAYAAAVGLDPEEVLRNLADRLPVAPDPSEALRARARERFAEQHPVAAALRDRLVEGRRQAIQLAHTAPGWHVAVSVPWRHVLAVAVDVVMVAGFAGLMLLGSSWIMRTDVAALWRAAWWPLTVSWVLMAALYATLSQQLARRTPGAVIIATLARAIRQRHGAPRIGRWQVWS